MIKKLKEKIENLFTSKTYEIELNEVQSFIEEHSPINKNKANFNDLKVSINNYLFELKQKLSILEKAKLKNENIQKKLIDLMKGNREAYLKRTEDFLDSFPKLEINSTESILEFINLAKTKLGNLNKNTTRAFYVLREFFGQEVGDIAKILKQIDDDLTKVKKSIEQGGSHYQESIKSNLNEIQLINEKKDSIKGEINILKDEISNLNIVIDQNKQKIESLIKTDSYLEIKQREEELIKVDDLINKESDKINNLFKIILHPLGRIYENDNILKTYNLDPTEALISDRSLQIYSRLSNLLESLNKDMDAKNKEKLIEILNELTLENLKNLRNRVENLQNKKKKENNDIQESEVMKKLLDYNNKIKNSKDNISRNEEEIISLEKSLDKYSIENLVLKINEDVIKLTGKEVKINS